MSNPEPHPVSSPSKAVDVMAIPTVTVKGVTVEHNTVPWRAATNRHPNIDGTDWGWIEGAPGSVCWSNNGTFDRTAAGAMVREHNQWLEDQKPLSIRMIEARERWAKAKREYDEAKEKFARATDVLDKCDACIAALSTIGESQ